MHRILAMLALNVLVVTAGRSQIDHHAADSSSITTLSVISVPAESVGATRDSMLNDLLHPNSSDPFFKSMRAVALIARLGPAPHSSAKRHEQWIYLGGDSVVVPISHAQLKLLGNARVVVRHRASVDTLAPIAIVMLHGNQPITSDASGRELGILRYAFPAQRSLVIASPALRESPESQRISSQSTLPVWHPSNADVLARYLSGHVDNGPAGSGGMVITLKIPLEFFSK